MANPASPSIPFGKRSTAAEVLADLDLTGRTILITGCNSGIGLESMRTLAARGAHVIGLARSTQSAKAACATVNGKTTPMACDLANLDSVRVAVRELRAAGTPLDAIIANAGIVGGNKPEIRYGVELQFLVNYLSHFLLINALLDQVPDGTGRIVVVSSSASVEQAPKEGILFDDLDAHRGYKPFIFYGQSKLAQALHAMELARRLASRGIAVNAIHPGAVGGTGFGRNFKFPLNMVMAVASRFMKTIPQGAATQVLLAASPLVAGITGEYWADCQIATGSKYLKDQTMAKQLWSVSESLLILPTQKAA